MKICRKCHIEKPITEFGPLKQGKNGRMARCKSCHNEANREYYHRTDQKNRQLKKTYGIDLAQKTQMFLDQNKACQICEKELHFSKAFVDHCHTSGRVRGLLCSKCNTVLGFVEDNAVTLQNAVKYLQKHTYTQHTGDL